MEIIAQSTSIVNFTAKKSLLVCGLLVISSCSIPDYSKPISDFAEATSNAEKVLSRANTGAADAFGASLRDQVLREEATLDQANCNFDKKKCELTVSRNVGTDGNAGGKPYGFPPKPPLSKSVNTMRAIASYAKNLAAISSADTVAKVNGNVEATFGSVQNIATTLNKGKAAADFTAPVLAVTTYIIGQYVDRVKLKALQAATNDAQPVLDSAAHFFSAVTGVSTDSQFDYSRGLVGVRINALSAAKGEKARAKLFDSAVTNATTADKLAKANTSSMFKLMAISHDKLRRKISNRDVTVAEVVVAIQDFTDAVNSLLKLFRKS